MIAKCNGCKDVIYFNDSVKSLLYDCSRRSRLENNNEEKLRITKLAEELIRSDIQEINTDKQSYFSLNDLDISMLLHIPESLQYFIQNLSTRRSKLKACVRYFLSSFYFSANYSSSKTMKNVFYFT